MLGQLDTLIGFVVVMSLVSLMVMIATQVVSTLLGLRGNNLHDAIETLFHHLAPQLDRTARSHLINCTLANPIASDTTLSTAKHDGLLQRWMPGARRVRVAWLRASAIRADELLELVQRTASTPIAQTVQWLHEARQSLLELDASTQVAFQPALAALGRIFPAPVEAHSAGTLTARLAAAGAPAPASPSIGGVAPPPVDAATPAPAPIPARAGQRKKATAKEHEARLRDAIVAAVHEFRTAVDARSKTNPTAPELARLRELEGRIGRITAGFDAAMAAIPSAEKRLAAWTLAGAARAVVNSIQKGRSIVADERVQFEKWFNSAQDRAAQWFTMHTRIVTVIAAIFAAFALQLDTFQVFRVLAASPDIRARLVARADALQREQEQTLAGNVFTPAMHAQALAAIAARYPAWSLPKAPLPRAVSVAEAEAWFGEQLRRTPSPDNPMMLEAYRQAVLRQQLDTNVALLQALAEETRQSSLQLLPSPYPPYPIRLNPQWTAARWRRTWPFAISVDANNPAKIYWCWPLPHLCGICVSAALLALGAPFWFSLLKGLTSLRPALADAIDAKPKPPASSELNPAR